MLNFGTTGFGAHSRLEMEQLRRVADIDVVHIPYKGGAGPAIIDLLGGQTHVMFVTLASALSLIQGERLKALGISTRTRNGSLPQVPTMIEAGFPEMVSGSWQGVFVPAHTPRRFIDKLHAALLTTLAAAETRERLVGRGAVVVTSSTPDEFTSFVDTEVGRWGKIAWDSGATVD